MSGLVCALTGHRDLKKDFDRNLLYDTLEELIREGYTTYCCGMARGFDLTALECLCELKRRYHVRLLACIPYAEQGERLGASDRNLYRILLADCDEKHVLSEHYYPGCMFTRNRYMVDRADLLLAYFVENSGGTAYTVKYARSRGVEVRFFGRSCDF